jgi:hypothetical protein
LNIEHILPGAIVPSLCQRLGLSLTLPLPQAYSRRAGVRRLTTEYDGMARRDAAYTADRRALCDPEV